MVAVNDLLLCCVLIQLLVLRVARTDVELVRSLNSFKLREIKKTYLSSNRFSMISFKFT